MIASNPITFSAGGAFEEILQGTSLDSTLPLLSKGTETMHREGHIFNTPNCNLHKEVDGSN